ncbi:DUF397 domain-containing protein [Micromonospora sp. NPDC005413]|uniref:DUF397 domain-containing protein n=1 Tax=Micromonospora sp. NPDC005413 TaxID=3154563 RepID=UPI0033AC4C2D
MDSTGARWRKSVRSGPDGGNCVEVAVRDSKDPTGPVLAFTPDAWRAFVGSDAVRAS